jgi:hypothetical protein
MTDGGYCVLIFNFDQIVLVLVLVLVLDAVELLSISRTRTTTRTILRPERQTLEPCLPCEAWKAKKGTLNL